MSAQSPSVENEPAPAPKDWNENQLDVQKLAAWITSIWVVTFDLELGQALEFAFPPCTVSDAERMNICFLSFPDSNSAVGNLVFTFRAKTTARPVDSEADESQEFLYGYVYFRQAKDASISRGYLQKSIVILSKHPFVSLFKTVVSHIGNLFFEYGTPLLEAACHNIASWPTPNPGAYELPILGHMLSVTVPQLQFNTKNRSGVVSMEDELLAGVLGINLYTRFRELLPHLWVLWELVLTGEPVMILANGPDVCSDAVLSLISIISPLAYAGDFRPFFTINDPDFKTYSDTAGQRKQTLPAAVLGVTNPFFTKALEHWPHVVTLGSEKNLFKPKTSSPKAAPSEPVPDGNPCFVATTHRSIVQPDKVLLKALLAARPADSAEADEHDSTLRRHFFTLTEAFMQPLERYLASLMPLQKAVSAFAPMPRLRVFSEADFLKMVHDSKDSSFMAGRKADWINIYKRFIRSANFHAWFASRRVVVKAKLRQLYLKELYAADVLAWIQDKNELEIVDLLLRLRAEMTPELDRDMRQRLEEHCTAVVSVLPEDLRDSILRNFAAQRGEDVSLAEDEIVDLSAEDAFIEEAVTGADVAAGHTPVTYAQRVQLSTPDTPSAAAPPPADEDGWTAV